MKKISTLFFKPRDYQRIIQTLERLAPYILCKFILAGSLAKRYQFPDWGKKFKGAKLNDIDLVLDPGRRLKVWLDKQIKKDFFVTYIYKQSVGFGYYMALIDKHNYVRIDIFTSPRNVRSQPIQLNKQKYLVLTKEEIFFRISKAIYESLTNQKIIAPKHVDLFHYIQNKIDQQKIQQIWPREKKFISQSAEYDFSSLVEYKNNIEKLVKEKNQFVKIKKPGALPQHDPRSVTAFGITVEDPEDFSSIYQATRQKN